MNWFSVFVGLRYTLSRKQSHLVAFISRMSTIGMVLAVSVLITVTSVMNGFDKELRDRILAIVPHATLTGFSATSDWHHYVDVAKSYPGVVDAAPFSYVQSLMMNQSSVKSVLLYGLDPDFEKEQSILKKLVGDKLLNSLDRPKSLILGRKLAFKLNIGIGETIKIIVPSTNSTELPVIDNFVVLGYLESGTELDEKIALTHRQSVAILNKKPIDSVDGIRISVADLFSAGEIADELSLKTELYNVKDWSRTQGNLFQAIQMSRKLVLLLVFIIIAVAAFNVVSTLVLAVNDKSSDIAILRTMGCSSRQIVCIFIVQGGVIGFIGVTIGIALGVIFSLAVSDGVQMLEHFIGYQFLKTDVYPLDHLPSDIRFEDIITVAAVALFLSIFATILPAWQASKVEPATVLRYE